MKFFLDFRNKKTPDLQDTKNQYYVLCIDKNMQYMIINEELEAIIVKYNHIIQEWQEVKKWKISFNNNSTKNTFNNNSAENTNYSDNPEDSINSEDKMNNSLNNSFI